MNPIEPNNDDHQRKSKNLALALGASQMGIFVSAGLLGGLWLDRLLGTMPVFGMVGLIGGFMAGIQILIRLVRGVRNNGT